MANWRRLAEIAAKIEKVYSIGVWELPRLNPGIFTYMQIIKIADFSHSKTNERSHFNVFLDDLSLGIPYAYVRYRRVMLIDKILDYAEWGERETNWLWVKQMADIVYESEGSARGSLDDLYSGSGSKPKRGNPTIHRPEAYSAIGRALGGRRCHDVARNEGPDQDPTPEPHCRPKPPSARCILILGTSVMAEENLGPRRRKHCLRLLHDTVRRRWIRQGRIGHGSPPQDYKMTRRASDFPAEHWKPGSV